MYQIALCDDEKEELNKTEQMLKEYERRHSELEFMVETFEKADKLLERVRDKEYMPDIVLMDIYMPEKMGIDVAKELRKMGNKGQIVFLTVSREHALEAFGVEATQYLIKPVTEHALFPVLDRIFEKVQERRKYILLRIEKRIQRVAVNDILYCEAQGKTQCLYMADSSKCMLHMTMADLYEILSHYQEFVRVGVAYIVNLEHIESLNAKNIEMDNKKKIHLPRGSYQPLREKYFQHYCEG